MQASRQKQKKKYMAWCYRNAFYIFITDIYLCIK